jgi:serine protease
MGKRRASALGTLAVAATTVTALAVAGGVAQARPLNDDGGMSTASAAGPSTAAYRHGWVEVRGSGHGTRPAPAHSSQSVSTANDLLYQGGTSATGYSAPVGVTTGAPRVYLVFYGSQWGTQGTNGTYATFSGDPKGMAPDLQAFFTGLGTGGETWSGVTTQYCEGVAAGTVTCLSGSTHVGYPSGGALAGVWEDNASASPYAASAAQLGTEAERAAVHFGNTTPGTNRNAQYFIVSPTGTSPDNWRSPLQWCAWHDYTGDGGLGFISTTSTGGPVAFTNLPYLTDVGASCGQGFVNGGSAGTLDGATIVGGHEYAETITDQFPAGGWVDSSGNENGDKCAWIGAGNGGASSQDITLTTGSFAVQSTWANDGNGGAGACEVSHPIVTNVPPNTVTVGSVSNQSTNVNTAATSVPLTATDSGNAPITWSSTGLPAGLTLTPGSGYTASIGGTPTVGGTYNVTVTASDGTGGSGFSSFTWTVNAVTVTNPGNQSTRTNTAVNLTVHATDTASIPALTWSAPNLPAGLSIQSSGPLTAAITGTTSSTVSSGSVTVTATDTNLNVAGSATFTWTVSTGPNTITVTNPGTQSTRRYSSVSLQLHATDSGGAAMTWSASNLPRGLSINSSTGLITGSASSRTGTYTVTVTVTDATGGRGTTTFSWTIHF